MQAVGITDVPTELTRHECQVATWDLQRLLLSQTCGYRLVTEFEGILQPLVTLAYAAPGCEGTNYSSLVVVQRRDQRGELSEFAQSVCAVN